MSWHDLSEVLYNYGTESPHYEVFELFKIIYNKLFNGMNYLYGMIIENGRNGHTWKI